MRSPMKDEGDDEEELAALMQRLEAARPPAEVLKVGTDFLVSLSFRVHR